MNARRPEAPAPFRYHDDGTLYTCADEGYFCEISDEGVCTECGWPYDAQGDRLPLGEVPA